MTDADLYDLTRRATALSTRIKTELDPQVQIALEQEYKSLISRIIAENQRRDRENNNPSA